MYLESLLGNVFLEKTFLPFEEIYCLFLKYFVGTVQHFCPYILGSLYKISFVQKHLVYCKKILKQFL